MDTEQEATLKDALAGASILLVDDNEIFQQLAATILDWLGARVCVAADGLQAVTRAEQQRFDLILMDVEMPRMGGLDATRAIRLLQGCAGVPILGYTSRSSNGSREKCIDAGMNDVIHKPSGVSDLYSRVSYWLAPRRPPAA